MQKYVTGTTTPLPGVEFLVTDSFGTKIGSNNGKFVTNEDGQVVIDGLTPGVTVTVKETKTVNGYVLDTTEKSVGIRSGEAQLLVFYNAPRGALKIIKRDAVTNQPLAGATFQVLNSNGEYVDSNGGRLSSNGIYVTDASGEILLTGLSPATLVVRETAAPDGYVLDDTPQTVNVNASETQTLTFRNVPTQTVIIRKYAEGTTNPLQGVRFQITDGGGTPIENGERVTNENGEIVLTGIAPGTTVIARETKTVRGYALNGTPQNLTVRAGAENALTFYDEPLSTLIIKKLIAGTDNEPLSGVGFKIVDGTGKNIGTSDGVFYTDDNGTITIPNLERGTTVKAWEISVPDGFVLNGTPQDIEIQSSDVHELTYWNQRQGSLTVRKLDSVTREPLSGAEFKIVYADGRPVDNNGGRVSTNGIYTTNDNGEITISGVSGAFVITEQKAPQGYSLNPDSRTQTVTVNPNDGQVVTFYNDPDQTLTLQKYAENSETPVQGAVFLIKDGNGRPLGTNNGEFTTDRNGQIIVSGLTAGTTVTAQEIRAADGYTLDSMPHSILIRKGETQTLTVYNTPKRTLTVNKFVEGTDTPIRGVRFQITDANGGSIGSGEYVTNERGQIVIPNLDPGAAVTVREVKTVRGYALNGSPQSIVISSERENVLNFYDVPLSTLIIRKYVGGMENEPLSGVGFKVTDGSGAAVGNTDGVHYTDDAGEIRLENLEPGTTLTVREISATDGFVLDGTPKTVEIRNSDVHELVFWNERQGALTVRKLDSATREPVPGAEFKLAYADGRPVENHNGQLSSGGIYTTDSDGEINVTGITGTVVITERKAAPGYTISPDSRTQTVVVNPGDTQTVTFFNTPNQTLTIQKFASDSGEPLAGVAFLVTDADGATVGSSNGQYVTDQDGRIVIENLTPGTVITAKETRTVSGYVLDATPQSIRIREGESQTLAFYNTPKGSLTVRKLDGVTEQPLEGAEFRVETVQGAPADDNEGRTSTGGIYRTDESGRFTLSKLQPGIYVITESKAPDGYVLDATPKTVTVNANDAQTVTFRDVPLQTLVIQKYADGTSNPLAGVAFLLTDANGAKIGEYVTDENGRIVVGGLQPGLTVVAREIRTVEGYHLNSEPQTVRIAANGETSLLSAASVNANANGGGNSMTFYDTPLASLLIHKFVEGTDDLPLAGVEFKITDGTGKAIGATDGVYYTDDNGEILIQNLEIGTTVRVRETKTVDGYVLDGTPKDIEIQSGDLHELTFWNRPAQTLVVQKYAEGTTTPIPGTEFLITDSKGAVIGSENGKFVTDGDGRIVVRGLTPGMTVTVKETKAAAGYAPDGTPKSIAIQSGDAQTLTFYDTPLTTLTVSKFETGSDKPLSGVTFLITDGDGRKIGNGEYVTDENGRVFLDNLEPGATVIVRETKTVDGYALNGAPQSLILKSGEANALSFYDDPLSTLVIRKFIDGTENEPLSGVEFKVTDGSGKNIGESDGVFYTDDNGEIVIGGLEAGTVIKARETKTVAGFVLDGTPKDIEIQSSDVHELVFWNRRQGGLTVKKLDSVTNEPIPGAEFRIAYADGRPVDNHNGQESSNGVYVTNDNGEINIVGVTGTIIVTEEKAASGYSLDAAYRTQTVIVNPNETQTLTFYNAPDQSLILQKYEKGTANPVQGARFLITDGNGGAVGENGGEYVTDENGRIAVTGLKPGTTVTAREIEPAEGYVLDAAPKSVTIRSGNAQSLTFYNEICGTLVVVKRDGLTNEPLQGATFQITNASGEFIANDGGRFSSNGRYVTDESGRIIITGLDADTLVVKEVEAPDGYSLDDTPQTVKIKPNDTQTLTFKDVPLQSLVIEKFIDGTTKPLAGVTFLVTDSGGNPVGGGEYVTDENGRIVINGLAVGTTVVAREIRTVKGYHLNGTPRTIQIGAETSSTNANAATLRNASATSSNGNSMTFYDEPLATLVVRKFIDGTENEPLSGVEFKITDGNGKNLGASDGVFYTDDNGEIVIENLEIGTIVKVRETKTVPGFVLDGTPKDIEIQSSDLHELVFKNQRQGALTARLRDSATQAPLGDAEFRIVYADGRPVDNANGQQSSGGVYRTDENGEIHISDLTGTVVITQTKTVDGYTINAASAARTVIVNPAETQTIDFANDPNQTLTVTKIASDSGEPLAGVTFLVTSSDGTVVGPANGEYVTDANGRIAVSNLVPGTTVTVKETRTVSGYVLDTTPQSVEIRSGEAQNLTFRNSPKGSLTVRLIDDVTERILPGAEFKVTTAAGTPVDNNEGRTSTNGAYRTDEGGQFTIAGLRPGIYNIVQTKAPEGYVVNEVPQTVTVNADDAQTVTFRDVPLQTLTVWNYVAGTTTPLNGSGFLVTDGDGKVIGTDNGICRTDENGRFVITGLEPGVNVHVTQTSVTDGYVLNGNPQIIRIRSGEAQNLTFYNEPCGTLVVLLRDKLTEQPVKDGVFQIMSASGEFIADNGGQLSSNGRYVTDESGQIIVTGLQPATLVVRQTEAPAGYVLDDAPQTVEVYANESATLTFKNVPTQTVIVQKFVQGTTEPLAGVRFLITDGSGENIGGGEYVTDENGRIAIDGIAPGTTVIARETRTVKGYTLNGAPKSLEVVSGQENVLTFYDEPLSTLIVHCYVEGTDNEPLANVGFKVTDGNDGSIGPDDGVYYTDRAGNIELPDLEPGLTVKVRMFKIAPEYVLDGVPQDIVMESGAVQELTFWAKRQGALTVRVLDSLTREPVPNAEFKLAYADGRPVDAANGQVSSAGQYFTDSNGEISVTGVTGTVIVTQEKPNDKYTIDADNRGKTVTVNPAETQTLTFFETPAQALTVQLYVRNTTDLIAGARFLLTDGRGTKLGDENGEFITDENGRFALSGLTPGVTVSAKQLTTADGYLMDGTPKTVEIKSGNAQNLTFYNDPAQTLTVRLYVKGTTTPIAGASFLVRDSGGAFIGDNNGEFTTDRNGQFTITGLTPGVTVTATQTATVSGYVLDTSPQNILIKKGNAQSVTFYNAPKGALTVRKLDSVTEEPLQGAEFKITTVRGTPVDNHEGKTSSNGLYTTDVSGEIVIEKLEPGVYTVVETKAPDGYALDRTPQTVTVNEDDSQTLTFRDEALQNLVITKYEEGTTKPLAGVTFAVSDSAGNPLGTYTTDANGQIVISGLAPGMTVIAREIRTVRGYVLNGEPQTVQIASGGGNHNANVSGTASNGNSLVFYDEPLSALIIRKYIDGTDNEPLSGVEFEITDGRGAAVGNGTYCTDANGEIRVENLEPGMTVTVRETKTVAGYVLDGTPKTATIPNSDVLEMTFRNRKQGNLVILKQDSETRQPLPGVEFKVVYADGKPVADNYGQTSSEGQYFTDENGEIRISGVVGTVIVTEENTIPGYTIDPNARTKTVTVEPNDTQTITFFNSPKQTLVIQKYASGTTNPIAGAAFYVTDSKGSALGQDGGEFMTDANGRIVLSDLTPGITVTARETRAANGYALDATPKSIAIQSGNVQTLTFYNTPVQTVTVRKYVRGATTPIPGVTFIITDGTGAAIGSGEYVTNENGEIVLRDIEPGTVINAREVRTATGYALNGTPQSLTVRSGQSNALTFYDEPLTTLVVRKYVAGTDNEPLANVEFKVTDGSGAAVGPDNGIYRTDAQGEFRIPNLEAGVNITVRETKAPDGYVLDGTPQTIQIKFGEAQSLTFWNSPTQTLTIRKLAEGTDAPLKGVTFRVTDQNAKPLGSANGEFTTDEDGKIVITGLTPGDSVTAVETKAADGYVLDTTPKSIVIRSGEAQTLTVYNSPKGTLVITKRDKFTEAPLKGATFQIMTADGKFVANAGGQLSSNGIYTTDDKGQIIITDLDADTLVVKEVKAPDGYLLDDTPQTVKVGPKDTQTLTFYDEPEKVLTIQKYEEGTTNPIQGVMFLVTDSSGATVGPNQGEYTTDRNGRIVLTGLTPGTTITAKEIRTADGYVLDTTPQSVLVKAGEAQTMTFYNKKDGGVEIVKLDGADKTKRLPNTTFEIRKQDGGLVKKVTTGRDGRIYASLDAGNYYLVEIEAAEGYKVDPTPEYFTVTDGKTTTLTVTNVARSGILLHKTDAATGKALYGVTFLLYDSRNNPIGQYSTDNMGYVRILDLEAGQYFLRELENKGYIPDTQMKTVYVKSGETTLIEWKNTPIMGQIQITKKSADYNPTNGLPAGTPLEGAVFQIFDKAGNVVDTVQTDSRGVANSKPLPLDRYTFKEMTAPAHYGVNETEFTAYLEHEGQIERFEVTDKSLVTGVSINKTGPKEAMAGQPVNYRFDHIGNTSNVRLEKFYWRDVLPPQIRLQKIVTGTYNFPGSYKITFRVNGGEPRTLADNLSTSRNYTLDASPTALGLASNEMVTEVMFVFGQVPGGFAQVEAPAILCSVIPNVLAPSFVNAADVGGLYNGQWIQGVSRWTTTVYRKPVKLPRTGY